MLSREKVGARIRQVRTQQHKTLRDVESASGFSSTHISEIERGRTSPTIGALIQIAHALNKDPSFFIEERELDEVCVISEQDRAAVNPNQFDIEGTGIRLDSLTNGILGGRLQIVEMVLEPGASGRITRMPEPADICIVCLEGAFEIDYRDHPISFQTEDSLHAIFDQHFGIRNGASDVAKVLFMIDPGMHQS